MPIGVNPFPNLVAGSGNCEIFPIRVDGFPIRMFVCLIGSSDGLVISSKEDSSFSSSLSSASIDQSQISINSFHLHLL